MTKTIAGPAIAKGYPYRLRVSLAARVSGEDPPALFPAGVALRAQVRTTRAAAASVGELTTANGGITRISDSVIEILLSASITNALVAGGTAHLDFARTDVAPAEYVGLYLGIPVRQPVTVPA